ncbi:MAG: hypothetical protein RLZZ453_758 [Chlamydiota bacterium]
MADRKSKFWVQCFLVSLGLHLVLCAYFYCYPPQIAGHLYSLFGLSVPQSKIFPEPQNLAEIEKNEWLADAFETIVISPHARPHDLKEIEMAREALPSQESIKEGALPDISPQFSMLIDQNTLAKEAILEQMHEVTPSPLFQALEEKARVASALQVDDTVATLSLPFSLPEDLNSYEEALKIAVPTPSALPEELSSAVAMPVESSPAFQSVSSGHSAVVSSDMPAIAEKKSTLFVPAKTPSSVLPRGIALTASKDDYELPTLTPKALWSDDFSCDLLFTEDPKGEGILFTAILTPVQDLSAHHIKQNFHFLIDHTASSHRHRFNVFKKATLKAIGALVAEDYFNIRILDKTGIAFSKRALPATLHNKRLAEEFLEKQTPASFFASGNVYESLADVITAIPSNEEAQTAILFSDGLLNAKAQKQQKLCKKLLQANRGRLNLYTAAVGENNQLVLLDLLASQSGGKLVYSDTHAAFPRKVAKLVLDLKSPLAKEISITAKAKNAHIELYPISSVLPMLYANEPYVVYGKMDHPSSFELIIQGRHQEDWIGIKKFCSLKDAHAMSASSVKKLKKMQASLFYERFLDSGKLSALNQAKELLTQSQKEIPFK